MPHESPRAVELRARAAEFAAKAEALPPGERNELLARHRALLQLADVEIWIAAPAHVQAKHDYQLAPKKVKVVARRKRLKKPGRKVGAAV